MPVDDIKEVQAQGSLKRQDMLVGPDYSYIIHLNLRNTNYKMGNCKIRNTLLATEPILYINIVCCVGRVEIQIDI